MPEKALSFLSPGKLVDLILKINAGVLNIAVYISSFLFLGFLLAILIPGFALQYYLAFWLISLIVFHKNKKIVSAILPALKKITIFISASIIFLFLNYFLSIFNSLNEKFFAIWKAMEKIINESVFSVMLPIALSLIYIYLVVAFLFLMNFIAGKIKLRNKIKDPVMGILLIIFVIIVPFVMTYSDYLSAFLEPKLYPKIGWIFSVSLIALHSNYLIKELSRN